MPKTISVAVPEACTLCPRQCKADRAAGPANSSSSSTTFMAQGGTFCVSTGRALPSFAALKDGIPMNGPTVLFNGAAIYDFATGRYLCTAFLPERIRDHVRQLTAEMPDLRSTTTITPSMWCTPTRSPPGTCT